MNNLEFYIFHVNKVDICDNSSYKTNYIAPRQIHAVLRIKFRVLYILYKHCFNESYLQLQCNFYSKYLAIQNYSDVFWTWKDESERKIVCSHARQSDLDLIPKTHMLQGKNKLQKLVL